MPPIPRFSRIALLALSFLIPCAARAQSPPVNPSRDTTASAPASPSSQSEAEATRQDLKQMRVILNQMANNLAFVSDSQSPLKHQFQLEIEMWQVIMMRMQRRLDTPEPPPAAPSPK